MHSANINNGIVAICVHKGDSLHEHARSHHLHPHKVKRSGSGQTAIHYYTLIMDGSRDYVTKHAMCALFF